MSTVTFSEDVTHAVSPPFPEDIWPDDGEAAGAAPGFGVPFPLAAGLPPLADDEAGGCGAGWLPPVDPQAAAIAAAAVRDAAATPRRAVTESVIITMPFVIGREHSVQTLSAS
jgi:hypothetical protein